MRLTQFTTDTNTRTLASELGLSLNTVNNAYEQLCAEGYIERKVGQGTRVTARTWVARLTPLLEDYSMLAATAARDEDLMTLLLSTMTGLRKAKGEQVAQKKISHVAVPVNVGKTTPSTLSRGSGNREEISHSDAVISAHSCFQQA